MKDRYSHINTRSYGDLEKLKDDAKSLRDVFNRQGASFMVDVLADSIAEALQKFPNMEAIDREKLVKSVLEDFESQLLERI